jgi:DNA-binding MarR family transcriptional regulator
MQTTTTDQERDALSRIHAALLPIIAVSPTPVSLSMIMSFLTVATKEGRTVKDIAGITGLTQSATSRLLMDLSRRNKFGGTGLGLIEQRVDDHDPRYMRNYLSETGRALVRKMVGGRPVRAAA